MIGVASKRDAHPKRANLGVRRFDGEMEEEGELHPPVLSSTKRFGKKKNKLNDECIGINTTGVCGAGLLGRREMCSHATKSCW